MMNERIKELAQEAGFVLWGTESWGPGEGHVDWSCDYEDALVKYTELIVKECINIASKEEHWAPLQGPIEIEIRQHFGVEE